MDLRPRAAEDRCAVADGDVGCVLCPYFPRQAGTGAVRHGLADHLFPCRRRRPRGGKYHPYARRGRRQDFPQELWRPERRIVGTWRPAAGNHDADRLLQGLGNHVGRFAGSQPMSDATVNQQRIALLGVPIEIGASQAGTLMGPAALRTAGIARLLEELEFTVEDHGDLARPNIVADGPPPANAKYYDEVKSWIRVLSEQAFVIARTGAIPIFMGGDHSLSMGSVNGVARHWQEMGRPLFVLWLDAHADYNTPATTITGNMHGMSSAFLCGEPGLDQLLGNQVRASITPDQ